MDPISQLGREAYHALCVAFAAQNKDKLYAPETDVLLEEARQLLGVSEDEDSAIRAQIEKDPVIAALRRGELPPGGVRAVASVSARAATPYSGAGGHGGMPPPSAGGTGLAGGGFETPLSAASMQQQKAAAAAKKTTATPASGGAGGAAAAATTTGGSSSLIGRKLQRYFPDLSTPWVTGTILQYNAATNKHLISYGPPLKREVWECVDDFAPQNFRWVEPGTEPAVAAAKSGGAAKTGGGSKSTPKSSTPKAPPPPPPAPKPAPSAALLPGGPSTFHATGVTLTAAPYNDGFLRASITKNRPEDLFTMLAAIDDRETAVVREMIALLDDPGDIADITGLLEQSQQLGQREQQLRAELREWGVTG